MRPPITWNAGRVLLVAAVAVATSGWLLFRDAGEGTGSRPASAPGAPARGDLLVLGISSAPATLLEPFGTTEDEQALGSLVLPSLMNVELRGELVHVPALAERWEWSGDGRTITFHLNEAAWDDGEPITAADVVATYRLVGDKSYASRCLEYVDRIEKIDEVDARTVRFAFRSAYYRENQLSDANVTILPAHVYGATSNRDVRGTKGAREPVGHGKFRVTAWDPEQGWTFERNERVVTDARPWLRSVRARPILDYGARLGAFLTGQIDTMDGVRPEDAARVRGRGARVIERKDRSVDYVIWNRRRPPLDDRDVRRALTLAINRAGMIGVLFRGPDAGSVREAIGATSPLLVDAYANDVHPLPYDAAEAARLLDGRGWKLGADRVRRKDGEELGLRLLVNRETARRVQTATLVQQDLRAVGIAVDIASVGFAELHERCMKGDFDAAVYGVNAPLMLKQGDLWKSGAAFNFADYRSEDVDRLVDGMREETDRARICDRLKRLQRIVYDDQPVTFLWWFGRFVAVGERFRDFHADALSYLGYLERCWVPLDLQRFRRGE